MTNIKVIKLAFALAATLLVATLCAPAIAQATTYLGVQSTCSVVNTTRQECTFAAFSTTETTEIQYVSMLCQSAGTTGFNLQDFFVSATPPSGTGSSVEYFLPPTVAGSIGGGVTAGSTTAIFVPAAGVANAYIDYYPAPSGTTKCTVSLSGLINP